MIKNDLKGQKFGKWTVEDFSHKNRVPFWNCICECGFKKSVDQYSLVNNKSKSCGHCGRLNSIGKKFGKLTILEHYETKIKKCHWGVDCKSYFKCICECGNISICWIGHLTSGHTKSCGCLSNGGGINLNRKYKNELAYAYFSIVKRSAKKRDLKFNITINYIYNLFLKQNRKCYLTGLTLILPSKKGDKKSNASLDRIDSSKGYIKGNLAWTHKEINRMKNIFSKNDFINWCKLVTENN